MDGSGRTSKATPSWPASGRIPLNIYNLAQREHDVGHPRAALEAMSRIRLADVPAGGGPLPPPALSFWAALHHELGEYDKQLDVARLGEQRFPGPGNNVFFTQEVGALVALGRMAEVEALIPRAEKATMPPCVPFRTPSTRALPGAPFGCISTCRGMRSAAPRPSSSGSSREDRGNLSQRGPVPQSERPAAAGDCRGNSV